MHRTATSYPPNDSVNGNWTYTYDNFNRLASANATGQPYTYDYDRFGNRWHQNGPHLSSLGFDANNHVVPGSGVAYDAAGDTTTDGSHTYFYDAEQRLSQVDGTLGNCSTATACYVYNANGQRVRKTTGSTSVDFAYDIAGHEIAEFNSSSGWNRSEVYAGGRHLATYRGGPSGMTYFIHADWLGTERARSTATGTAYETCTSLPFGDWLTCPGPTDPSPMHFTGKERDTETATSLAGSDGLDNFGARYDSSRIGRFMSPDPENAGAKDDDPQSWNAYAYARNNPLLYTDPNGLDYVVSMYGGTPFYCPTYSILTMLVSGTRDAYIWGDSSGGSIVLQEKGKAAITIGSYREFFGPADRFLALYRAGLISDALLKDSMKTMAKNAAYTAAGIGVGKLIGYGVEAYQASRAARAAADTGLSGTALARQLGQAGEDAVGITGPKVGIQIPGSGITRFPDQLTSTTLTEVKNVKNLSFTQQLQLQDYSAYAQQNRLQFNLYVRPSTTRTGPLQNAVNSGQINLFFIP